MLRERAFGNRCSHIPSDDQPRAIDLWVFGHSRDASDDVVFHAFAADITAGLDDDVVGVSPRKRASTYGEAACGVGKAPLCLDESAFAYALVCASGRSLAVVSMRSSRREWLPVETCR